MSDLTLRRRILDELEFLAHIDAGAIGVTLENGVVVLTGHVKTYSEKIAVERAVQAVKGVLALAEELEVRVSGPDAVEDSVIASRCLDLVRWSTTVSDEPIHIKVQHGWVTIQGNVEWQYQKEAVQSAIEQLQGVSRIDIFLVIQPKESIQDIKRLIDAALTRSAGLDTRKIRVSVHGNQVTLEDTVAQWRERKAVEQAAWAVAGVTHVENHLLID